MLSPRSPWSPGPGHTAAAGAGLARHPAWPLTLLLAGIPLWWALGFGDYIFILLSIPMAARLYAWSAQGNRRIRVPPGFGLWLLFLLVVLIGAAALAATAPGTLASPVSNRLISFGVRTIGYLGDTALLLFAGNLTERELPRRRLAWLLGLRGPVRRGSAACSACSSSTCTSLRRWPPSSPTGFRPTTWSCMCSFIPPLSQLQAVLGTAGRPNAPFPYTNEWGNCLALLLPWLIARWWFQGTRRQRMIALAAVVLAIVPIIYSLDRGLWLGLIVIVGYLGFRLAAQGPPGRTRRPGHGARPGRHRDRGHPVAGNDQPAPGQRRQ